MQTFICIHPLFFFARAERFELPSTVLETAILPLNYARVYGCIFIELLNRSFRYSASR